MKIDGWMVYAYGNVCESPYGGNDDDIVCEALGDICDDIYQRIFWPCEKPNDDYNVFGHDVGGVYTIYDHRETNSGIRLSYSDRCGLVFPRPDDDAGFFRYPPRMHLPIKK